MVLTWQLKIQKIMLLDEKKGRAHFGKALEEIPC